MIAILVQICGSLAEAHGMGPPVPMSLRLGTAVPADLDQAILGCLSKDPRLRPQSADALSQRLIACLAARGWSQPQMGSVALEG